jgi:hypothetical protein
MTASTTPQLRALIPVTDRELIDRRIGYSPLCTAVLPPGERGPRFNDKDSGIVGPNVRTTCNQPTTHIRLVEYADRSRVWRSVCPRHATGDL